MGQPIRTLEELSRKGGPGYIEIVCRCGHVAHRSVYDLAKWFRSKRWDDSWPAFAFRLKCDECGARNPAVRFREMEKRPEAEPPKPAAPGMVPMGIDPVAWANARDESERKRLVRKARG